MKIIISCHAILIYYCNHKHTSL